MRPMRRTAGPHPMTPPRRPTLATPVDLRRIANATDAELARRLHPAYADAIGRLPAGRRSSAGCRSGSPRRRRPRGAGCCSTATSTSTCGRRDRRAMSSSPTSATRGGTRSTAVPPTCRSAGSRRSGSRWRGTPSSWHPGRSSSGVVRRRFEINDGIVGWGQGAFAAVPAPGRHAARLARAASGARARRAMREPGHAGLLGILPGSWGPAQTGRGRFGAEPDRRHRAVAARDRGPATVRPSWRDLRLRAARRRSTGAAGSSSRAITAFRGIASPLAIEPRRTLRIDGRRRGRRRVRRPRPGLPRSVPRRARSRRSRDDRGGRRVGDGPRIADGPTSMLVDLAMAPDATLAVGRRGRPGGPPAARGRAHAASARSRSSPCRPRRTGSRSRSSTRGPAIPPRRASGSVAPTGATSRRSAIATRSTPGSTRTPAPTSSSAGRRYAYVPGRFPIEPAGRRRRGRGRPWLRPPPAAADRHTSTAAARRSSCRSSRVAGPAGAGWIAVDCHVHFISPTSALLQAQAEGVAIVNLLATQWGDHHTSVTDLPVAVVADPPASTSSSWAARTVRTCSATSGCSERRTRCCRWPAPGRPRRAWATRSTG